VIDEIANPKKNASGINNLFSDQKLLSTEEFDHEVAGRYLKEMYHDANSEDSDHF
jgi:hypothetical protein